MSDVDCIAAATALKTTRMMLQLSRIQLAQELGVPATTISNWQGAGKIPQRHLKTVEEWLAVAPGRMSSEIQIDKVKPRSKEGWEHFLLGRNVGLLTVIAIEQEKRGEKWSSHVAVCRCECGKVIRPAASYVARMISRNGMGKRIENSCGCLNERVGPAHHGFEGVGEFPKTLFTRIRHSAKAMNRQFNLTMEFLWELYLRQNRRCYYSGVPIFFRLRRVGAGKYQQASLDRLDSSQGYLQGNVAWTSWQINQLKRDMPSHDFISLCKTIAKFNSNRRQEAKDKNLRLFG